MPPRLALLRPDSGAQSGLGHVQRCLALAAALAERCVDCAFLVPDGSVRKRIELAGFPVHQLDEPETPAAVLAAAPAGTVVVVDSYRVDECYLRQLREAQLAVVVVDDYATMPFTCQLCVNGGAGAASLPYRSASGDTRFLLGPAYVMLRSELWDVAAREPAATVDEVLLSLGGSDPSGLAPALMRAIDEIDADFALTVVIGPYFADPDAIAAEARASRRGVTLLDAPTSFVDSMHAADLAVSAAGQTVYELARLAVPTIAIAIADNQAGGLEALAAAGAVRSAGSVGETDLPHRVARTAAELISDPAARRSLARAARAMVDGQGARRVSAAICELCP